jgi:hypothetical protein
VIGEIGTHSGIPEADYHSAEGVSQSQLKVLRDKSPAHLRWKLDHPELPTEAMRLGSAIHDAILLPDQFEALWSVAKPCAGTTAKGDPCSRVGKYSLGDDEWYCHHHAPPEAYVADTLKPDWLPIIAGVRNAIAKHPKAKRLLEGDPEVSAWWEDERTGLLCKGRFDMLSSVTPTIVDLKTTRNAAPGEFTRQIYAMGYYIQAAHYMRGARTLGIEAQHYVLIAVEKEPPFGVAVYRISGEAIQAGEQELDRLLDIYAECERTGSWPGYGDTVHDITLPPYAWRQIDDRLEEED